MAPEIPTGSTGVWGTQKDYEGPEQGHTPAFNDTVPAGNGKNISNLVMPTAVYVQDYITNQWLSGGSFSGVVQGCAGVCRAKIRAPAFVPSACTIYELPNAFLEEMDTDSLGIVAPPMNHAGLVIANTLVVGEHETINIVTEYADTPDCLGNISFHSCNYESAIGEYDVLISHGEVHFESLGSPKFIAKANNTAVDHGWDATLNGHPSTLAGLAALMFFRWDAYVEIFRRKSGHVQMIGIGGLDITQFMKPKSGKCATFRDTHQEVYESLNLLAVNIGWLSASHNASYTLSHMDDGLHPHTTIIGSLHGSHSVFHTDYWYFLGAVLVEIGCICLVAPTYWGWYVLGASNPARALTYGGPTNRVIHPQKLEISSVALGDKLTLPCVFKVEAR